MATGTILLPLPARSDSVSPPGYLAFNSKPRHLFDDTTDEIIHFTCRMPTDYASGLAAKAQYFMTSATTGDVIIGVEVMTVTPGDASLMTTDSYDTINLSSASTVPATATYLTETSVTLTNNDSIVAGDWVAFKFRRNASNVSDTAAGDLGLVSMSIEYTTA